ncbi:MAG: exodeoxyribonuclease VII large subunit [Leptospirillia bacterium]
MEREILSGNDVVYTVAELAGSVRQGIDRLFPGPVSLMGELSNVKLSQPSGHYYFTVRDAVASLRGVMFRSAVRSLSFQPAEGLKVLLRGRLSYYEARGEVQIVVDRMGPAGLGLFFQEFARVRDLLAKEGALLPERKRPIPLFPRKVALITSPQGAAVWDFLRIFDQQNRLVPVVVIPARVQGADAAADLLRAFSEVPHLPEVDVVVLTRGGGSAEDLRVYNQENVARAILGCPVPVVTAIGHEVDVSVADLVADLRVATPTEAAKRVFFDAAQFMELARLSRRRIFGAFSDRLKEERGRLRAFREGASHLSRRISRLQLALVRGQEGLSQMMQGQVGRFSGHLRDLSGRLVHPSSQIIRQGRRLSERAGYLVQLFLARLSTHRTARLDLLHRLDRPDRIGVGILREKQVRLKNDLVLALGNRLSREGRIFERLRSGLFARDPGRPLASGFFLLSRPETGTLVTASTPPSIGETLLGRTSHLALSLKVVDVRAGSEEKSASNSEPNILEWRDDGGTR